MASSTPEYREVVAGTPELLFGAVKDHHEWVPKLISEIFYSGYREQGDGETGSVYPYETHMEDEPLGGTGAIKMVMDEYNPDTLSYVVDFQGDPRCSQLKHHVQFLPGPDPNTTSIKWRISYVPFDESTTGAPDDLVAFNPPRTGFKDLAAFLAGEME